MRRVAARGVVLYEGKLLAVRLRPYNELAASGGEWWCLPGGTVEEGEAIEAAFVREMQEETGVAPVLGKLLYVHQFLFNGREHLEFFFHVINASDYLDVQLDQTSHGSAEIAQIGFVDPASTVLRPSFLMTEPLAAQCSPAAPVKFFYVANK